MGLSPERPPCTGGQLAFSLTELRFSCLTRGHVCLSLCLWPVGWSVVCVPKQGAWGAAAEVPLRELLAQTWAGGGSQGGRRWVVPAPRRRPVPGLM